MNKKSYIVAPGRQVDADRAYLEGDVIDLGEDHMPALLACGAVIEKGQSPEELEAEHKAAEEATRKAAEEAEALAKAEAEEAERAKKEAEASAAKAAEEAAEAETARVAAEKAAAAAVSGKKGGK